MTHGLPGRPGADPPELTSDQATLLARLVVDAERTIDIDVEAARAILQ